MTCTKFNTATAEVGDIKVVGNVTYQYKGNERWEAITAPLKVSQLTGYLSVLQASTVSDLETLSLLEGSTVLLKDRGYAPFVVSYGSVYNGMEVVYAGDGKVATLLTGALTTVTPENLGAVKYAGVTTDYSAQVQRAIDLAVGAKLPATLDDWYYVGTQIHLKGSVVGVGREVSGLVGDFSGWLGSIVFNPPTYSLKGFGFKSTSTYATCVTRGLTSDGNTPHNVEIHALGFSQLKKALFIDSYWWVNTFRDIKIFECGSASEWAVEYEDDERADNANNILWDGLDISSTDAWPARGIKTVDAYDITINNLHLEHLGDYAASFGGRAVNINGGYVEQWNTLGTGIYTSNKIQVTSDTFSMTGVFINCAIEVDGVKTIYTGCAFNDGDFVPAGAVLVNTQLVSNRKTLNVPYFDLNRLIHISRGTPINIPFDSRKLATALGSNGNFSGVTEKTWTAGELGESRSSENISLTTGSAYALANPVGLQFKHTTEATQAIAFAFESRARQGNEQAIVHRMSAWALVRIKSASNTLQVSFGLGNPDFSQAEKLASTSLRDNWVLLLVDDVSPAGNFVTFNLNKAGGGAPIVGADEYVMIDSFGICMGGINYDNVFGIANK